MLGPLPFHFYLDYILVSQIKGNKGGERCLWPGANGDFDSILGNTFFSLQERRRKQFLPGEPDAFHCASDSHVGDPPAQLSGCFVLHSWFCWGEIWLCVSLHPLIFISVCCYKDTSWNVQEVNWEFIRVTDSMLQGLRFLFFNLANLDGKDYTLGGNDLGIIFSWNPIPTSKSVQFFILLLCWWPRGQTCLWWPQRAGQSFVSTISLVATIHSQLTFRMVTKYEFFGDRWPFQSGFGEQSL